MTRLWLLVALALAGCGHEAARPAATATPTPAPARQAVTRREPLKCPVASSRAGWPSRVLALGDGRYVKLWGHRPRLADVTAEGHLLGQTELGARGRANSRALACGRHGRLAAAWVEYRADKVYALRLALHGRTRTLATARAPYWDDGVTDVALAFAPNGELLVVYAIFHEVRAAVVSRSGQIGAPFRLGPALEVTQIAADTARSGRTVVAWTTIDSGEERNERRRIYAVTRTRGGFGRPQLVHRARGVVLNNFTAGAQTSIRLAVAPNGRALLLWHTDAGTDPDGRYPLRVARARPHGRFGASRQLSPDAREGDVAIRSDGAALAVWIDAKGLRALVGSKLEVITSSDRAHEPAATFHRDRPRVEWRERGAIRVSVRRAVPAPRRARAARRPAARRPATAR